MFKRILIANRGEIALRVIRACKELDISTVAVYSQADTDSLHVRFADEAVCIGPPRSADSYLNIPRIIGAAEVTDSDAIHPGYGFLAENAQFAEVCKESGIEFIGPSADTISHMGDKALARKTMKDAGIPILPGSGGTLADEKEALREAERIGYPVILKATAGGGGKGMRIVNAPEEMSRSFVMARVEADTAFGNGALYIEHYLTNPRHVEVQIMGYMDGTVLTFGERDCSIQRRHQKLIEESPSPGISQEMRGKLLKAAVAGAKTVGYIGAGTFEFLVDAGEFFFMEMNARIQVEHPISEIVCRIDLVKEQIRAVAGAVPGMKSHPLEGHAIECRINAEDPDHGFTPSPGKILAFNVPGGIGIRVDTHVYVDYVIPQYYDSLIAKLISFGEDRKEAISRMSRALDEFIIEGVATTIPLHKSVMKSEGFASGNYSTSFMEQFLNDGKYIK